MGTKAALKEIRQHIDAKEFKEAQEIIENLLKKDVADYLLFVFAAITNAQLGNYTEAINFYKKAADIDEKKPLAWQGLYRLYEQGNYDDLEHVLIVIDNLLLSPGLEQEKVSAYEKERSLIFLKLRKFDDAFSKPKRLDDVEFCEAALKAVLHGDSWNGSRNEIVEKCLVKLDAEKLDSKTHRTCAELRCSWAKSLDEIRRVLLEHVKYLTGDEWLINLLRYAVAVYYLERHEKGPSCAFVDMLKNAVLKDTDFEILLGHIQKEEMASAIKNVDENLKENRCIWPYIGLAVPVLLSHERYEQVLSLLKVPVQNMHPVVVEVLSEEALAAKCEALYAIHDSDSLEELRKLLADKAGNSRVFRDVQLAMLCENAEMDDASKCEVLAKENFEATDEMQYWKARLMVNSKSEGSLGEAKDLAESAVKSNPESWKRLLLLAEICLKLNADDPVATSKLVKAAKLNPYSSCIFFNLGKSLKTKNRTKAITCLERAAKIRPQNIEVAELLDDLLGLENRTEEQLQHMRRFARAVPSSLWACKRLALLEVGSGNISAAIEEMQRVVVQDKEDAGIWTALGDAYKKRGNYQSAIKAYKEAVQLKPSDDFAQIQFIQMCQVTGQLDEALEQCVELEKRIESGQSTTDCVFLLHAETVLKLAQKSAYSQQFALLNQFFELIGKVFVLNLEFSLCYKIAADALLLASRYHEDTFKSFKFPETWNIVTALNATELAVRFCCIFVKARPNWPGAWNDLGVALIRKCRLVKDSSGCSNAVACFKRAIMLCSSKTTKSIYWTNLSQAVALTENALLVQHCLVRALQLNKRNDNAWLLLGVLYLKYAKVDLARQALNMAQKINPESAEIWCVLATIAESENHYDTWDLYRHSLTLKPTELAVKKYTYYMMKMLEEGKQCDDATMFDFESVHEIIGVSKRSDEFVFFLSLLAEHFWYLDYAVHYIHCCNDWPNKEVCNLHKQRIAVRSGNTELFSGTLHKLSVLYSLRSDDVYEKLLNICPIYAQLFAALEQNNLKHFRALFVDSKNKIQIPLFIAAVICFGKKLSDDFISVLDEVKPRHQIGLVFPPDRQRDENDEFSYDVTKEVGEKTIVRYHNMSKRLCDLLAVLGELYRSKKIVEVHETSEFV